MLFFDLRIILDFEKDKIFCAKRRNCAGIAVVIARIYATIKQGGVTMAQESGKCIAHLMRENQKLRRELRECRDMLQNIFVKNLIEDSVDPIHTSNLSSQLEKNGIRLPYPDLLVCTLDVIGLGATSVGESRYPASHEEFNHLRDTVLHVCCSMLNVEHLCYPTVADNEILLLVNFCQPSEARFSQRETVEQLAQILSKAVSYLQNSYSILIAAVISQPTQELRDLTRTWQESKLLFEQTAAISESCVITSYDVTSAGSTERYRAYNDKLFYIAVLTGDIRQARALTDAYIDTFVQSDNALWELKSPLKKRLRTAVSLWPGAAERKILVEPEIDAQISRCKNFEQLTSLLDRFFGDFVLHMPSNGKRTDPIRQYIRENFWNCELGVELLCQRFGYSASYLSHLYKQEQEVSLVDEITKIRVQEAKKRLASSSDSVTAIAEQVGYRSAWTLTRAFRRCDGISPTQYRRNHAGIGEVRDSMRVNSVQK